MDKGMDIDELHCVLACHAAAPDSPRKLQTLIDTVRDCREVRRDLSRRYLERQAQRLNLALDWLAADIALAWGDKPHHRVLSLFDSDYPQKLHHIAVPPAVLFVVGDVASLAAPQIAIVGSRKASPGGLQNARTFATALCDAGYTITSGLAHGVDAAAHRAALGAAGSTVAVFGNGIDRIYPSRHRDLAAQISEQGALVSEFPLGAAPRPYHFPRRNRIISGLSCATLVIEAAQRSGSMSSAYHAMEQGSEVFAIPGSINNPMAAGCHHLIREGATLAGCPADVIEVIGAVSDHRRDALDVPRRSGTTQLTEKENRVVTACAYDPAGFDQLIERTGLTAPELSSILSALEVAGVVQSLPGNFYLQVND